MAIKNWLVRGDTHGNFLWMTNGCLDKYKPEETAIIILGDAGFNFYLNKTDARKKKEVNQRGYTFYCVRGNHEERPHNLSNIKIVYDPEVSGLVYIEEEYPNIKYLADWGGYKINGYKCLVIGGAYSVDKAWRLANADMTEETNDPHKSGWFNEEQLSEVEMNACSTWLEHMKEINENYFDFVLTHTCPKSFQPVDKFLPFIDQSTVDTRMEDWMEKIKEQITFGVWLFGHYHDDRIEAPHVEMYYNDIEELNTIAKRWENYDETGHLDWWLVKSPLFDLRKGENA